MGRGRALGPANEIGWENLTEQQRAFSVAWVKYHNPRKALDEAKYAWLINGQDKSKAYATQLIKRCKRLIMRLEDDALRQANISVAAIQHELAKMGFSNPQDYMIEDEGFATVATTPGAAPSATQKVRRPKTLDELTRAEAAAIKEFSTRAWTKADGTVIFVLDEVKLHDKRAALVDLGKTIGMFQDKPASPVGHNETTDFSRVSTDELKQLEAILRKAAGAVSHARDATAIESPGAARVIEHKP